MKTSNHFWVIREFLRTNSGKLTIATISFYTHLRLSINLNGYLGRSDQNESGTNNFVIGELEKRHYSRCCIFIDGSKNRVSNYIGDACVCPRMDTRISTTLNDYFSSYTAECIALTLAIKFFKENPGRKYVILSGSLSACQAIASGRVTIKWNPYFLQIKEEIHKIAKQGLQTKISILWIDNN